MAITDVFQAVKEGGLAALLVLVLCGFFYIAIKVVPSMKDFFASLVAQQAEIGKRLAVTDAKVDTLIAAQARMTDGIAKLGDVASAAIGRAGDGFSAAVGRIGDQVAAEGFETRSALTDAERRLTAVVRREQTSDPPPGTGARHTPATGVPALPRRLSAPVGQ